jgi:hypothetical protein
MTVSEADLHTSEGVFVYAVVRAGRDLPELAGLDDAPIEVVETGQVAAVVSRVALDRPPGRRADLVVYDRVVAGLAERGVVAPVRFGALVPDTDAVVQELLAPREELLADVLQDLTGHVQFNLRATYVEGAVLKEIVDTDPQIRALRDRTRDLPEHVAYGDRVRMGELVVHALELRAEADAADIMDAVLPHVVAYEGRGARGAEVVLDVALLVHEDLVHTLEDTLEGIAEAVHERMHLRLVGPLAPFDFVGEL